MTKLCQGPNCHTYDTTDRKRGPKGNKRNETRKIGWTRARHLLLCDCHSFVELWDEARLRHADPILPLAV